MNMDSFAVSSAYMNPGCLQEIGIIYSFASTIPEAEGGYVMVGVVADVLPSALFLLWH